MNSGKKNVGVIRRLCAGVDRDRLWQRLMEMAEFGAIAGGGVNRQALTPEDIEARELLIGWGRKLGLSPSVDGMANLFLRLEGDDADLPPLLIGSHMDSQPRGGRFDGIYGVLAALEVLEVISQSGLRPGRTIELVAWTNEEGGRFAPGSMGSLCFAGHAKPDDFHSVKDNHGVRLADALASTLEATPDLSRRPIGFPVAGFLEAHIEQGPQLERAGLSVGIVSGIQGSRQFEVEVIGESAHAGTTPRAARRDALQTACRLIVALDEALRDSEDILRFTVGRLRVSANAPNSVPELVRFSIDMRHPVEGVLDRSQALISEICNDHAQRCAVRLSELARREPCAFDTSVIEALRSAADWLEVSSTTMTSGAFHDAQALQSVCPTAMVFVPCRNGVSHNPAEYAEPGHLADGARILAGAAWLLAG